jgi:hypothetical protein
MQANRPPESPAPPFRLSLHIRHPSIDPDEISRELRCGADESFRAGQPRNRGARSVYAETYWAATLGPQFWAIGARLSAVGLSYRSPNDQQEQSEYTETPLDVALRAQISAATRSVGGVLALVCARLAGRHTAFLSRLRAEGGQIRVAVTLTRRRSAASV